MPLKVPPLKKVFTKSAKVLGGLTGSVLGLYGAFILTFYAGRGDPLSAGDRQLLHDMFGEKFDVSDIRTHFHDKSSMDYKIANFFLPGKKAMAMPLTSHIVFFDSSVYARDFTALDAQDTANVRKIGYFGHESFHDLQYKTDLNMKKIGLYKYHLSPEKKFSDYGIEQQAEMVERYLKVVFFNDTSNVDGINDTLLIKTVEDRFPTSRATRLRIEDGKAKTGRADFCWKDLYPEGFGAVKKTRTSTGRPATTSR